MTTESRLKLSQRAIRFWLVANVLLFILLYVRVKVFLPDILAAEYSILTLLWVVLPVFGMLWLVRPHTAPSSLNPLMQVVVVGVSVYGTYTMVQGFVLYPSDAQGGLSLAIVPLFQWLVLLTAFLFCGEKRGGSK